MDEKPIEREQEHPVVEKKVYTPPALTVYGKLTELTAGGSLGFPENAQPKDPNDRTRKS